jgi:addiction module RelE/StbE family toxin
MIIKFHKDFVKSYKKLSPKLKQRVDLVIFGFRKNPLDPVLKNHALKGEMGGKHAISVTGNIRILFEEHGDYLLVIMLDVGTHSQIYG